MKRILIIIIGLSLWTSSSLAEIIFNNCDLSPNYGKVKMTVYLEKNQVKLEDSSGILKLLDINEKNSTTISANDNSNEQINELFMIDIKYGVIRVTVKPSDTANQSTKDSLKNKKNIINTVCKPENLYSKKEQQKQGVAMKEEFEKKILIAMEICKRDGQKTETIKQRDDMMGCIHYQIVNNEEKILATKLKEKENIELKSEYKSKSGEKITKESKWTKFWQGVGWILYEHGDDIFDIILDLKYGTNYSKYGDNNVSTGGGLNCVAQRVGNVVHQNCKGNGVHIYCMYQKVGSNQWKRTCREK